MAGKLRGRILVVEDDPDTSLALSLLLRLEGFEVTVADNGRQAYRSSLANPPDLVVTDLSMPVMSGFELIEAFRHAPLLQDVPIVAVSAFERVQLQTASRLGAVAVYQKPLDFERFLTAIGALLSTQGPRKAPGSGRRPHDLEPRLDSSSRSF